ncbi:caspase family protein, partial [bacterium]|nr:caspase family protein [bacterium]
MTIKYINNLVIILLVVLINTNINAADITVIWKKENTMLTTFQDTSDPMTSIHNDIAENVNKYLVPRKIINIDNLIPSVILKPIMPEKVEKPKIISKIDLKQGKYEPSKEFSKRLEEQTIEYTRKSEFLKENYKDAITKRNELIESLSENFKINVDERNEKILKYQTIIDNDRENIKKEQREKESKLNNILPIFVKNAFKKYLSAPIIVSSEYYVNSNTMEVVLVSSKNNFKQKLEFSIKPGIARKMDKNLEKVNPKVYYHVENSIQDNSINLKLDYIKLEFEGEEYLTAPSRKFRSNNFKTASIVIDNTMEREEGRILDLQINTLALEYQKPNFEKVTYSVTSNNNDILTRLNKLDIKNEDPKKWLFVLGIENYSNGVDSIAYSKKSSQTFAKVAKKLLGVSKQNSFLLIDKNATSGKIKSELRRMLSLIKDDDTLYFYYSGHGIPVAIDNNEPYILPQDIDPSYINFESFYKLNNIYKMLSESKAKKVIAVIDSCFSGATDGVSIFKG